jgi:hypothetical protein
MSSRKNKPDPVSETAKAVGKQLKGKELKGLKGFELFKQIFKAIGGFENATSN